MLDKIKSKLQDLTNRENVVLLDKGNSAIKLSLMIAKKLNPDKKDVIIQDQGGWITYLQFPKKLGLVENKIKTDNGVIIPDILKNTINEKTLCLLYESPSGYIAEQDIDSINKIAKGKNIISVLDASGMIGFDDNMKADIVVASFGRWKPISLEYGGFVSVNDDQILEDEKIKAFIDEHPFDESKLGELLEKLNSLEYRIDIIKNIRKDVIEYLERFNFGHQIIHKDKSGINVVVKFQTETEKKFLMDYCQNNGFEYIVCPKYTRVLTDAISIEIKRKF